MVPRTPKHEITLLLFPGSPSVEEVSFSSITYCWQRSLNLILPELQREFNSNPIYVTFKPNQKKIGQIGEVKKRRKGMGMLPDLHAAQHHVPRRSDILRSAAVKRYQCQHIY